MNLVIVLRPAKNRVYRIEKLHRQANYTVNFLTARTLKLFSFTIAFFRKWDSEKMLIIYCPDNRSFVSVYSSSIVRKFLKYIFRNRLRLDFCRNIIIIRVFTFKDGRWLFIFLFFLSSRILRNFHHQVSNIRKKQKTKNHLRVGHRYSTPLDVGNRSRSA